MNRALQQVDRLLAVETDQCVVWPGALTSNGYGHVRIGKRMRSVHVLALEHHVGPRPAGTEAAHLPRVCHTRACMNHRHLRWATPTENKADMDADGTSPRGERNANARLTDDDVRDIRSASADGRRAGEIAARFGVDRCTVNDVLSGRTWRHVA